MVVDTSALIAIALGEGAAETCREALAAGPRPCLSATTLMETLVVARGRDVLDEVEGLLQLNRVEVVTVTEAGARAAAAAYARWGKGVHPARLNLVDCFAYALARERGLPLLYVGEDFAQTDVASALSGAAPPRATE